MTLYYKMQQILLQNATCILLKNASGFLLQNATVLLQIATVLLQTATVITKCDFYYKLQQYTVDWKGFFFKVIVYFNVSFALNNTI